MIRTIEAVIAAVIIIFFATQFTFEKKEYDYRYYAFDALHSPNIRSLALNGSSEEIYDLLREQIPRTINFRVEIYNSTDLVSFSGGLGKQRLTYSYYISGQNRTFSPHEIRVILW